MIAGDRNIPSTKNPPNDYMWEDDSHAIGQSTTMQLAPLGWIIQMRLKRASNPSLHIPHTAILYSRDSNGFTFLDSNWLGDSTVRLTIRPSQTSTISYLVQVNSLVTLSSRIIRLESHKKIMRLFVFIYSI